MRKISTEVENKLWKFLRNKFLGQRFYRQFGIEHLTGIARSEANERRSNLERDVIGLPRRLTNPELLAMTGFVIVDGEIHDQKETAERDFERQDFLESLGFKVLRFKNNEVINDLEKVLRKVKGFFGVNIN